MKKRAHWTNSKVIKAGLLNGILLNLFGWLGNALVLKSEWQIAAGLIAPLDPPNIKGITRELLTFVPDFIYGYLMVIIYHYISQSEGYTTRSKMLTIGVGFFFSLFATYFGLVTANLLPLRISLLTTIWGLFTFFPAFFLAISLTRFDEPNS